ncbi:hypothetical protein LPJ53_003633 [Coemansia erecta]|uniref:E3 ubiquitin ligase complex SCF subunit n=1 Tax=Coemansia erecta TaxID=147472 RepID=A0A9W7Y0T2_9FUNG|nr:hypothetical protein LPJ53_003633 [Coemansia erecta]
MSLVVRTSTGTDYTLDEKVAAQMGGLKELITETTEDGKVVKVLDEKVKDTSFKNAIEFCKRHQDDPPSIDHLRAEDSPKTLDMTPWDEKFISMDTLQLLDMANLADWLKVEKLMDVACKKIAGMVRNKSAEDIRKMFNIVEDFDEKELEQIRKENEWLKCNSSC